MSHPYNPNDGTIDIDGEIHTISPTIVDADLNWIHAKLIVAQNHGYITAEGVLGLAAISRILKGKKRNILALEAILSFIYNSSINNSVYAVGTNSYPISNYSVLYDYIAVGASAAATNTVFDVDTIRQIVGTDLVLDVANKDTLILTQELQNSSVLRKHFKLTALASGAYKVLDGNKPVVKVRPFDEIALMWSEDLSKVVRLVNGESAFSEEPGGQNSLRISYRTQAGSNVDRTALLSRIRDVLLSDAVYNLLVADPRDITTK